MIADECVRFSSSLARVGLQANRGLQVGDTVECVLERALLDAGRIAPSNYGDLFKVCAHKHGVWGHGVPRLLRRVSSSMCTE